MTNLIFNIKNSIHSISSTVLCVWVAGVSSGCVSRVFKITAVSCGVAMTTGYYLWGCCLQWKTERKLVMEKCHN